MAATANLEKITISLKLDDGTTTAGGVKTVSQQLANINTQTVDDQKVYNIATLLAPCLSKSIYQIAKIETSSIQDSA